MLRWRVFSKVYLQGRENFLSSTNNGGTVDRTNDCMNEERTAFAGKAEAFDPCADHPKP